MAQKDRERSAEEVERAVRELHAPRCHGMRGREGKPVDSCDHCYGPDGYNATYPCATIQALDAAIRLDRDFRDGAEWARAHLAQQGVTDGEVLAALNADYAIRFGPRNLPADSLEPYGDEAVRIMRAALTAARAARRDEE